MQPITAVLVLLIVQAALGAFDTVVSHEWRERLPAQPLAARELSLHAARSTLFALIFIGVAWFEWHGAWGWAMLAVMVAEYLVTTIDSIVEDGTRVLSPLERSNHMLLAVNTGLYIALFVLHLVSAWARLPTAVVGARHDGWLSLPLTAAASGALLWALRDARASRRLRRLAARDLTPTRG